LSGSNNNGVLINGPTFSSTDGGSFVFDGTNRYIVTPINIDANPSTVGAWFNPSTTAGDLGIALTDNGVWDKGFEINSGQFAIHNGNGLSGTGRAVIANTWYYGVVVYSSLSIEFYVNGVRVWVAGAPGFSSGSTVEIGRANYPGGTGSRFFKGRISQV
jgi:hypothetical protein